MIMKAFVVAISGIPGSGAAQLCDEFCRKTEKSAVLHFGEFHKLRQDFDSLDLSEFKADVEKLAMNKKYECVFLDYPLGRHVKSMSSVIDFVFFVDTPPDMALARSISRELKNTDIESVRAKLRRYQEHGHDITQKIIQTVPRSVDVVLSAENSLDDCEHIIMEFMRHLLINRYALGSVLFKMA